MYGPWVPWKISGIPENAYLVDFGLSAAREKLTVLPPLCISTIGLPHIVSMASYSVTVLRGGSSRSPQSKACPLSNGCAVRTVHVIVAMHRYASLYIVKSRFDTCSLTVNNVLSVKTWLFAAHLKDLTGIVILCYVLCNEFAKFVQPYHVAKAFQVICLCVINLT